MLKEMAEDQLYSEAADIKRAYWITWQLLVKIFLGIEIGLFSNFISEWSISNESAHACIKLELSL